MMDAEASRTSMSLQLRLATVAELGQNALAGGDVSLLMHEALALIARILAVRYCAVWELLQSGESLLLRAGVGWKKGLVGNATVVAGCGSQAGYTLHSNEAVIVEDCSTEARFGSPRLLHDHEVVSGMSVVIATRNGPFGVLAAYSTSRRLFEQDELDFMQSIANVLARAIERRRAEEALQESEKRYKDLTESLPQVVFETDAEAYLTFANCRAFELFGYTREDFDRRLNVLDMVVPEDRARGAENIRRVMAGEKTQNSEYRLVRKDGSIFPGIVFSAPRVIDSAPVGIRGILIDITERKRMEEELRTLSYAVEQSPASVVITDRNGLIEYVNPRFTELTGYRSHEVLGKNPRILKSGLAPPEVYQELWSTITAGREWKGELQNRKKNGELYWEHASISPITDSSGRITHFIAIKEDITERKRLEQQFLQAQKMEAVGRLAGGIAHDFNNLLTVILGTSDLVLESLDQTDPICTELRKIKNAGKRAATLTSQLLAFSRKQDRTPRTLDLNTSVAEVAKMLGRLMGEDIEVVLRLGPDAGCIYADPVQLDQIIMNLAVNARDAMPSGGTLILETANVLLDEAYARNHVAIKPGRYSMLAISDTGCGMTPEVQAHLFEPFFTTKEKGKGTGLGLSTVYGIVKQSDAYIWVYSEPNRGTTFKIYMPALERPADTDTLPGDESAALAGSETVLVVEDDPDLRALACKILRRFGYAVLEAKSAAEAGMICSQFSEPIHLLMADAVMPGASGDQLARQLAGARPQMKVLYTSGYTDEAILRQGILGSATAFLQKPFTPDLLARKVREVLDAR